MVWFFILFFIFIGFIIAKKYKKKSISIYILLSIFWFFIMGPFWAVITFIELITGWGLHKVIKDFFSKNKDNENHNISNNEIIKEKNKSQYVDTIIQENKKISTKKKNKNRKKAKKKQKINTTLSKEKINDKKCCKIENNNEEIIIENFDYDFELKKNKSNETLNINELIKKLSKLQEEKKLLEDNYEILQEKRKYLIETVEEDTDISPLELEDKNYEINEVIEEINKIENQIFAIENEICDIEISIENINDEKLNEENELNFMEEVSINEIDYLNKKFEIRRNTQIIEELNLLNNNNTLTKSKESYNFSIENKEEKIKNFLFQYNIKSLWHFTDLSNINLIKKYGLLSLEQIRKKNLKNVKFGGNELSHKLDIKKGLDKYVHISFLKDHPMFYTTKNRRSIINPVWIEIDINLLFEKKIFLCKTVANGNNSELLPLYKIFDIDFEKMFNNIRTEARKAEVLVYDKIETKYIKKFHFDSIWNKLNL